VTGPDRSQLPALLQTAAAEPADAAVATAALIWTGLVVLLLIGALLTGQHDLRLVVALASAAAPGLATQRLRGGASDRVEALVIGGWALGGGLAAALTGGLSGPFGALCAAPLAAAAALDRKRGVSGAAALTLATAAVDLWVSLTGLTRPPLGFIAPWPRSASASSGGASRRAGATAARTPRSGSSGCWPNSRT
jgi:hypothetical protein